MSIWCSVDDRGHEVTPVDRGNYTGEPTGNEAWFIDVATAHWFHPCTRFILWRDDVRVELLLTERETRDLAYLLTLAANDTPEETP